MLINWTTPRHRNIQTYQPGSIVVYQGLAPAVTLEDILDCCMEGKEAILEILTILRRRGFRREKPSRLEIMRKLDMVLEETRDMRKMFRRNTKGER